MFTYMGKEGAFFTSILRFFFYKCPKSQVLYDSHKELRTNNMEKINVKLFLNSKEIKVKKMSYKGYFETDTPIRVPTCGGSCGSHQYDIEVD
jgi:hypothetical protein